MSKNIVSNRRQSRQKILFVCKHNRFRSKTAEAFFNKFNKNKKYIAIGGGLFPGHYPLDKVQVKVAKEFGIKLQGKPQPITTDLLREINTLVIVADDVPSEIFQSDKYGREEHRWNICDTTNDKENEAREIISAIESHVKKFVENLA
ncbi:MAG: hypothetical protein ACP5NS_04610 [Candidatus Pacearchaeota archaeon]